MRKTPSISFSTASKAKADTLVVTISSAKKDGKPTPGAVAAGLDGEMGGLVQETLKRSSKFTGAVGQCLTLTPPAKSPYARVILLGVGAARELDRAGAEKAGASLLSTLDSSGAETVILHPDSGESPELAAALVAGLALKTYRFDRYRDKKKAQENASTLKKLDVVMPGAAAAAKIFRAEQAVVEGVFTARDLVNMPPNDLYPQSYAALIEKDLKIPGLTITVMDEKKLKTMGCGAHLAVGQGSARPPRLVVMEWNGTGAKETNKKTNKGPLVLVGKGITFDTGGISLKPGANMDEMKMDMAGSAAVVGVMKALATRKAKAHVVGIVALAENMPSDRAYRPGDIITSLSGKTIEVLNTDAEGRLVLCDALTYAQQKYKPDAIIDLATLTGAIIVALGNDYCGSFVNDDTLWQRIETAGKECGEKYWRMPLDEAYRKEVESKVADLRNIGSAGKAGSCTAAAFLEWFVQDGVRWAHLDIAGTGMSSSVGGTGFGVRMLDRLVAAHYERA